MGQSEVLKSLVLRMFWDQEPEPSVEVPLGDFFGASFGRPRKLMSRFFTIAGGAYLCKLVMPFNDGARIQLRNDGVAPIKRFFYQLGYFEDPERATPEPTLHAQFRRTVPGIGAEAVEIVHAVGSGRFVGLALDVENRSWWLKPPLSHIALPRGFGLGLLEGWETIVVDGDENAALVGTGAEDYFSSGFYFKGAPFCTPTHGCTFRSYFWGRVSAYRCHDRDAIPFDESFTFLLDHGLRNQMTGTYDSTALWYQLEPHVPFPPLPRLADRRVRIALTNPAQWLLAIAFLGAIAALFVFIWQARK